ncbi:MAG: Hsp20/alpha crystallin family protein [Myxococcota bacterium]
MADTTLPTPAGNAPQAPETVRDPTDWIRPAADVAETDEGLELWLDLPGVTKEAVKLEVEGTEMRVEAARNQRFGYRRIFTLPREVDAAGISAQMESGVLHLTLPRSEAFTRRVISIA